MFDAVNSSRTADDNRGTAMIRTIGFAVGGALLALMTNGALAQEKVTVAYFLEWPTANQVAQMDKTYDKEMGVEVEWRAFGNGNEMTQAMVSGDVQIAYSVGFPTFLVGVSNGAPVKMVGVAVSYAEADLCMLRNDSGIARQNIKDLEGKKVATPIGNITHYRLVKALEHLGVDISKVELVQMNGADGAVALLRGDVVMACAFGGPIDRMAEVASPLMTGAELEEIGAGAFDIVQVSNEFAEEHPDLVRKFLAVTDKANQAYNANPESAYQTVSGASGMDLDATKTMMGKFSFPTNEEQAGPNWLGGGVQKMAPAIMDVMAKAGALDKPLDDYSQFIDPSFLK
jgi:taurine transport system substrate-binding protein